MRKPWRKPRAPPLPMMVFGAGKVKAGMVLGCLKARVTTARLSRVRQQAKEPSIE
jgi:hypothetical protein